MKIICIGRNYAEHAAELNNVLPVEPMFFCKPDSAILPKGIPFFIPDWTQNVQYEIELVLRINRLGKNISEEFAPGYFDAIGLGIDWTARDVQEELKKKGMPWEKAKSFDGSAVLSDQFIAVEEIGNIHSIDFVLKKNDELVQKGNSAQMIFSFSKIIAHVSKFMTLKIGDFIFTGTPAGVGPVVTGDILEGEMEGKKMLRVKVK